MFKFLVSSIIMNPLLLTYCDSSVSLCHFCDRSPFKEISFEESLFLLFLNMKPKCKKNSV